MIRSAIALAFGLVALPAIAAEIDFSSLIRDLDGKPIPKCESATDECKAPLTLAGVSEMALLAPDHDRQAQASVEDKTKRFVLAVKIHSGGKIDLPAEDVALLKHLIGVAYAPLVVGRANEILDPPHK